MALATLANLDRNYWLWATRFDPQLGWGECSELVGAGQFPQPEPGYQGISTAVSPSGEVLVVWQQEDSDKLNSIFYSYFRP